MTTPAQQAGGQGVLRKMPCGLFVLTALFVCFGSLLFIPITPPGTRRLVSAIEHNDVAQIQQLLDEGVDPDVPRIDYSLMRELLEGEWRRETPPLFVAIRLGHLESVRALIEGGACVDCPKDRGSPLSSVLTVRPWDTGMLRVLLESNPSPPAWLGELREEAAHGKDGHHLIFKLYKDWLVRSVQGQSPSAWGSNQLLEAARESDPRAVRAAYEAGCPVDSQDEDGWSALLWACSEGSSSFEIVEFLLEGGADPNLATKGGWTPLMAASHGNVRSIVRELVQAGAEVNAVEYSIGNSALHVAANYASVDVVRTLLEAGADVTHRNHYFTTTLSRAQYNRTKGRYLVLSTIQEAWEAEPWPESALDIGLLWEGDGGPGWVENVWVECSRGRASGGLWIMSNTVHLAFDILWRSQDQEWLLGTLVAEPGSVHGFSYQSDIPAECPSTVDLVLRPNRELAVAELDTWAIWGEEVIVDNLAVE